jgi:hypothetical protein
MRRQLKPGERREEGLFEKLECGLQSGVAYVRLGDRVARFTAIMENVTLITYRDDGAGEPIRCGLRTPADQVLVTWRDDAASKGDADGILVALEFLPR